MAQRFLRLSEVRLRYPLSKQRIYGLMQAGEFPQNYKLGARSVGWLESEIDAFIQQKIGASSSGPEDQQATKAPDTTKVAKRSLVQRHGGDLDRPRVLSEHSASAAR